MIKVVKEGTPRPWFYTRIADLDDGEELWCLLLAVPVVLPVLLAGCLLDAALTGRSVRLRWRDR